MSDIVPVLFAQENPMARADQLKALLRAYGQARHAAMGELLATVEKTVEAAR